jgi:hypothetical protein
VGILLFLSGKGEGDETGTPVWSHGIFCAGAIDLHEGEKIDDAAFKGLMGAAVAADATAKKK